MQLFIILIFYILSLISCQTCPSYTQTTIYSSGKITPISSFTTNNSIPQSNSLIYSTPLTLISNPPTVNYYYLALGVVGIQALSSNQISFNVTAINVNQTAFSLTTKILGLTYCNLLSYHYFAISYPLAIMEMLIYFDCFLTSNLATNVNKTSSQSFKLQNLPFADGQFVRNIYSVISGMRLINNRGSYFSVSLKSIILPDTNYIQHTITTDYFNALEFVCMSTMVVSEFFNVKSYVTQIYFNTVIVNQTNLVSNIQTFQKFKAQNMQFYGISKLQLIAQDDISFNFDTQNYTDISLNSIIGEGVNEIILSYMYFATNQMSNFPGKFYVPDTGQCVNDCSTLAGYSIYDSITCQKCHYTCLTCTLPHLNGRCDTCDSTSFRTLNSTTYECECNIGYTDIGVMLCQSCSSLISQCLTCQSSTYCLSCNSNYILSPDKTQCLCPSGGPKVSSFCLGYLGCLVANNVTNMIYCVTCDQANHFQKVLSNYTCTCMSGFQLFQQTCVDICGDGKLQNISDGCDDANLQNGDGCSQNCTIQSGFGCHTSNNNTISICSQIVDFQITYVYSYKIKDKNSVKIVFLVNPPKKQLQNMNFNNYIQSNISYTDFSSHYNFESSSLEVTFDLNQSIQNINQQVSVSFDPAIIACSAIQISFTPVGVNHKLTVDPYVQFNTYLKWTSLFVSCFAILITFGAFLISKSLLALQMLFPIQLTYVALSYFPNVLTSVGSLSYLKYSGGYNDLFSSYSYNTNYFDFEGLIISQQDNEFILNINYMGAIVIGFGILSYCWKYITSLFWKGQNLDQSITKIQNTSKFIQFVRKIELILSRKIFAFFGLISMIPALFAFSTQLQYKSTPIFQTFTSASYNTLAALVTLIFVFLAMTQCLDSQDSKTLKGYSKHIEQTKIQFFFLSQLVIALLFTGLVGIPYVQYGLFVIGTAPLIIYLYRNPYKAKPKFQRFTALFCNIMILINCVLFLIANLFQSEIINLLIACFVLVIILSSEILTIVRIIFDRMFKSKDSITKLTLQQIEGKQQEMREEENFQSQRQKLLKVDMEKMQQSTVKCHQQIDSVKNIDSLNIQKNQAQKQNFSKEQKQEKHQSNSDSQLDKQNQLQQIKKKLRADLLQRRGGYKKK